MQLTRQAIWFEGSELGTGVSTVFNWLNRLGSKINSKAHYQPRAWTRSNQRKQKSRKATMVLFLLPNAHYQKRQKWRDYFANPCQNRHLWSSPYFLEERHHSLLCPSWLSTHLSSYWPQCADWWHVSPSACTQYFEHPERFTKTMSPVLLPGTQWIFKSSDLTEEKILFQNIV